MKNLFTRLRSWYTDNRKYESFVAFVLFGFGTIFLLVCNILTDANPFDWAIWIIWLQTVLYNAASWQKDKHHHNLFEFYKELLRHAHESEYAAIENSEQYRRWLVSANRRRKRAERKLKNTRLALCKESAERLGFEVKCDEYESVYGSKEFCQQLFADAARDANVCLGALLGIKEEESPSTEIKENQQQ